MKVLTLHQPWASLIAIGAKTIETRSWSTPYRGPLAIHAGVHRPPMMTLPPLIHRGTPEERDRHNHQTWNVIDTITDPAYKGPRAVNPKTGRTSRVPNRAKTPTLFFPHAGPHGRPWDQAAGTSATEQGTAILLPLGAVVAVCDLVDVVPIVDGVTTEGMPHEVTLYRYPELLTLVVPDRGSSGETAQLPYGDFTPGRFGWVLGNVRMIEPVRMKGSQGIRDVDEAVLDQINERLAT